MRGTRYIPPSLTALRLLAAYVAGLLMVVVPADRAPAQQSAGIPGWPWETPLATIQKSLHLRQAAVTGRTVRYRANLEEICSIPVDDCQLEFTEGRFSGLAFTTRGEVHSRRILAVLEGTFGRVQGGGQRGFQWLERDTHVAYDEDSRGDAYVYLYDVTLQPGSPGPDALRQK